ncbi:MAG: 3-hydroxyacyl-[acyl-carrier-protein] dehydratase [Verrucomicrobiales bacterium]|jgi:3-hydroxyacyl-[acyl-carrier-protein] dehydratase
MTLTAQQLEKLLPHRPPILLIDEVVNVVPGESGSGVRTFKEGDPCFDGHFPGNPILPGVLAAEACAQTTMAVFLADKADEPAAAGELGLLGKINEMTFLKPITPGKTIHFSIKIDRRVGPFAIVNCVALEGTEKFATGKLTLKIGS